MDPSEDADESSETDSPDLDTPRTSSSRREEAPSIPAARLSSDVKRRFDELVRSSQSERFRLRQSQLEIQEREEELRYSEQLETADLWQARRLLQMCLAWWIALTRKQLGKSQNAADASDQVTISKAWEHWRAQVPRKLKAEEWVTRPIESDAC